MLLKSLTYTSRARLDLGEADVHAIYQSARHLNALDGVTGLLLFDGIRFLQIIEGADAAIDDLLARLHADPRHSALEIRDTRTIDARGFPEWSMQLIRVSNGYCTARAEVEPYLPAETPQAVRDLIWQMTGALSAR